MKYQLLILLFVAVMVTGGILFSNAVVDALNVSKEDSWRVHALCSFTMAFSFLIGAVAVHLIRLSAQP